MPAAEAAVSAEGVATMKRTGFLPLAAASVAVLLAGCVSDYQYREGVGDYYYGQPSVEYRDYGYGGYGGYGYPYGWGGSIGFGYGGYGYPYGGYGYPYGGYGYPYYPPLIFVPGYYGGHHHGGHDRPDPIPYRPAHPHRIGGDGTPATPIMMPSTRSRGQQPGFVPRAATQEPPMRRAFTLPPRPRAERNDDRPAPRIQVPQRSTRDRDEGRNSDR
jgi:hypothetical protein